MSSITERDWTLNSFVPADPMGDFPIHNLPYGVFSPTPDAAPRVGVAIGEMVLDLSVLEARGLLPALPQALPSPHAGQPAVAPHGHGIFGQSSLNPFMALGRQTWRETRQAIMRLLSADEPTLRDDPGLRAAALIPRERVSLHLPCEIGDYTDFYSSREHATNVGAMFRGRENALMPNWLHLPVAYHGRSSSIVLDGAGVRRPLGQSRPDENAPPVFGPCRALDFEFEVGHFIGPGNRQGEPIDIARAEDHVFGLVLVNDWSARDIQKWEYQPLGPFLAKNFATTISPWVVTLEALDPFRCPSPKQDPPPLPYLHREENSTFDIHLEALLQTERLAEPVVICRTNFRHLYWSIPQQLAHHTVGGCNLRTGDLLASGTISGPDPGSYGSLLELTSGGKAPLSLGSGESRAYLQDGDTLILRGWCERAGLRLGFGEARGRILPAVGSLTSS